MRFSNSEKHREVKCCCYILHSVPLVLSLQCLLTQALNHCGQLATVYYRGTWLSSTTGHDLRLQQVVLYNTHLYLRAVVENWRYNITVSQATTPSSSRQVSKQVRELIYTLPKNKSLYVAVSVKQMYAFNRRVKTYIIHFLKPKFHWDQFPRNFFADLLATSPDHLDMSRWSESCQLSRN